jgi:hypothetical protein
VLRLESPCCQRSVHSPDLKGVESSSEKYVAALG